MIDNTFAIIIIGLFSLLFAFIAAHYKAIEERLFNRLNSKISNALDEKMEIICSQISNDIDEKINIIKNENDFQNHTVCKIHGNISEKDIRDYREIMEDWVFKKRELRSKQLAETCKSEFNLK